MARSDFTRLKLVQGKKRDELAKEQAEKDKAADEMRRAGISAPKHTEEDLTAGFDASDDADVVF